MVEIKNKKTSKKEKTRNHTCRSAKPK